MNHEPPFTSVGDEPVEARIVSWVLGEASAFEEAELARLCEERPELLVFRRRMRALHGLLTEAERKQPDEGWKLPPEKRNALDELFGAEPPVRLQPNHEKRIRHSGRRALLAIAACLLLTLVVISLLPWKHESEALIEIKPRMVGISPLGNAMTESSSANPSTPQFFGTEFEKIKSRASLEQVTEKLDLTNRWNLDKEAALKKLKDSIETENVRGTDLVRIQVRHANKQDADDIAREVAYSYKDYREQLEQQDADRALAELNKAVRDQEDKVEERRKVLATIVRTKGIIYEGSDSFYGDSDGDADQGAKNALANYHGLEQEKMQLESQISSLLKYDSDQLMTYASGLNLPDNTLRKTYPEYLEAKRELEKLKLDGLADKHPTVRDRVEKVETLKREADEGVVNLRATLQAQLDLASNRLKSVEVMKDGSREEAIKRGLDAQDYVDAKREFETDQQLLQTMKLKQMAETIARKIPGESVVVHEAPRPEGDARRSAVNLAEKELAESSVDGKIRLRTEFPPELIEGTPVPMILPGLSEHPAEQQDQVASNFAQRSSSSVTTPRKPAAPSSAMAATVAASSAASIGVPVPEIEVAMPSLDFGDADAFGSGWSDGRSTQGYQSEYLFRGMDLGKDADQRETLEAELAQLKNKLQEPVINDSNKQELFHQYQEKSERLRSLQPKPEAEATKPPKPALTDLIEEVLTTEDPYSTFSLNISDASFQIAQAALAKGEQPDPSGIKVEQFYNAVDYGDPSPIGGNPVTAAIEQSAHPAIPGRNLVRIALKTAAAGRSAAQPLRLTLLVDQSGSMVREDRRDAMDKAITGLAGLLGKEDRVSVIGFSRTPRLLADAMPGDQAGKLAGLVNQSASEGGTNLEQAIQLAKQLAERRKLDGAQNRIVLFTDGAANLGNADPERLAETVKQLRQNGIAFDIAGIAADGLNDGLLAELARNGNGRYYVVGKGADDNIANQLAGAFRPAAENVKVQVRFNPERVARYKLIGFEKDRLKTEDFRNDAVDAAELAAEEAGVAIYQVEPIPGGSGELGNVSVRFRDTTSGQMVERGWAIPHDSRTPAFDRATPSMQLAVLAMFAGEKLKGGPLAGAIDFKQLAEPRANVKRFYGNSGRAAEVLQMIDSL